MQVLSVIATIDWITLITDEDFPIRVLTEIADEELRLARADAVTVYPAHVGPYEGIRFHGHSWALKGETVLLSLSGGTAHDWLERWAGLEGVRVTRLDVAVTVLLDMPVKLADRAYRRLADPSLASRYKAKGTIIHGSDRGSTVYVGSRSGKNAFGRLYDKGIQSKETDEDGIVWRYEVQLKGLSAQAFYDKIDGEDWKPNDAVAAVHGWFLDRGIEPVFDPTSSEATFQRDNGASSGNVDKKLKWLERSVRPVITELRLAGYSDRVYNVLGLKPSSTSEVKEGL